MGQATIIVKFVRPLKPGDTFEMVSDVPFSFANCGLVWTDREQENAPRTNVKITIIDNQNKEGN